MTDLWGPRRFESTVVAVFLVVMRRMRGDEDQRMVNQNYQGSLDDDVETGGMGDGNDVIVKIETIGRDGLGGRYKKR